MLRRFTLFLALSVALAVINNSRDVQAGLIASVLEPAHGGVAASTETYELSEGSAGANMESSAATSTAEEMAALARAKEVRARLASNLASPGGMAPPSPEPSA